MPERHRLNRRRIMREFTIKELSAVDRPAQGGALAVLMKRDDSSQQEDHDEMDFQKVIEERPRAFNSFEDAMAHLAKMEKMPPEAIAKYNSEGEAIAKAESERLAKLRHKPRAVTDFELIVAGIAETENVPRLRAMEIARRRHPREFDLFQRA